MKPTWYVRHLLPGYRGADVRVLRSLLGCTPGDLYDDKVAQAVAAFQKQRRVGRVGAGVDTATAVALGERQGHGDLPEWWTGRPIHEGDRLWERVEEALGYDLTTDDLKRFQGNFRIRPSGVVDEPTARAIHDFED